MVRSVKSVKQCPKSATKFSAIDAAALICAHIDSNRNVLQIGKGKNGLQEAESNQIRPRYMAFIGAHADCSSMINQFNAKHHHQLVLVASLMFRGKCVCVCLCVFAYNTMINDVTR